MSHSDSERSNKPTLPDYGTIGPPRARTSSGSAPGLATPSARTEPIQSGAATHGDAARRYLAEIEAAACRVEATFSRADLTEFDRAFARLEDEIGAMRVLAIAALDAAATGKPGTGTYRR